MRTSLSNMKRVLKLSHKPNKQEFKKVFLIVGVGVMLIGGLGFLVSLGYGVFN